MAGRCSRSRPLFRKPLLFSLYRCRIPASADRALGSKKQTSGALSLLHLTRKLLKMKLVDKVGDVSRAHLLVDVEAVGLDRPEADPESAGCLFAGATLYGYELYYLLLARTEIHHC